MRRVISIKPRGLAKSDRDCAPCDRTALYDESPTKDSTFVCRGHKLDG